MRSPYRLAAVFAALVLPLVATSARPQGGRVIIGYEPVEGYQELAGGLHDSGIFEEIGEYVSSNLVLPTHLNVIFTACGQPNAFYDPENVRIVMCYEFFDLFGQIFYTPEISDEELGLNIIHTGAFFFLHELGHAVVHILDLPITGREEDAVDDLAALTLLDEEGDEVVASALMNFAHMSDLMESGQVELPFWDEHSLNAQRAYNIACLMYGSDPQAYAGMVGPDSLLPVERAQRCEHEFERKFDAWDRLLEPYYP